MTLAYDNHEAVESWVMDIKRHTDEFYAMIMKELAKRPMSLKPRQQFFTN